MKRISILLTLAAIVAGGALFHACQHDDGMIMNPNAKGGDSSIVLFETNGNETYYEDACLDVCIDLTADPVVYYEMSDVVAFISNPNAPIHAHNIKYMNYIVYNTEDSFIVKLTYTRNNGENNPTVAVTVDGTTQTEALTYGVQKTFIFSMDIVACEEVEWSFTETVYDFSTALTASGNYNLIGVCGDCPEYQFDWKNNEDGSYTFTLAIDEDHAATDAELVFTFPATGEYVSGLEGWEQEGVTWHKTMDLEACESYSWTVFLNPVCRGEAPSAILWTDFKVNDVSLKELFELANIVVSCP